MSRTGQLPSPIEFFGLLYLAGVLFVMSMSGCVSTIRSESTRPVDCALPEVFARDGASYRAATLGMVSFRAPDYASQVEGELTSIYWHEMLGSGLFKQVVMIPHRVERDDEAIWWGRRENCTLIMIPTLMYMIDGAGTLTNRLEIGIRILDTHSGRLLWDIRQRAESNPGPDIDLYWSTIPGKSAQNYRAVARCLAEQTRAVLLPPPPPNSKTGRQESEQPKRSPCSAGCTQLIVTDDAQPGTAGAPSSGWK